MIEKLLENKPYLTVLAWNILPRKLARSSERAAKVDITASLTKLAGYKFFNKIICKFKDKNF